MCDGVSWEGDQSVVPRSPSEEVAEPLLAAGLYRGRV